MKIAIALSPGARIPTYATAGAAGADLSAHLPDAPITLAPGGYAAIPTGIRLAIPEGWEGQVRARSGLALRHGVTTLNAPGTLDADYRGEVRVILINHGTEPFEVTDGMRVAQLVFAPAPQVAFERTSVLAPTVRGTDGFGSTGMDA